MTFNEINFLKIGLLGLIYLFMDETAEGLKSLGTVLEHGCHNLQSKIGESLYYAVAYYVLLPVNFQEHDI